MRRKRLVKRGVVVREPGCLYYIDKNGDLYSVQAKIGGTKGVTHSKEGYYYNKHRKARKKKEKEKLKNE